MVDGEVLMADGEVQVADAAGIRQHAHEIAESLDLEAARERAQEVKP
jgi:hypothetical protein